MKYEIIKNPVGLTEFTLNRGESITGEAGSMSYLKGDITTETKMRRRFLQDSKDHDIWRRHW